MIQVGIILLLCTRTLAQIRWFGLCPAKLEGVRNLNKWEYMGFWYEVQTYTKNPEKCRYARYTMNGDDTIGVVFGKVDPLTGDPVASNKGQLNFIGQSDNSKWSFYFPGKLRDNFWILGTDYKNFAVMLYCSDIPFFHTKNVWIFSRRRELEREHLEKAYHVLVHYNLTISYLKSTNQQNCPVVSVNV